ncbi:hypothetical protein BC938DRAFT_477187 [Jimgerdemannia flammicorona]|uniref:CCZ1/INTU/HSP4 first Longin domain-containing protein n=1 Tax=Jimgerdemannia flammicorona TaxID=994334 RepID=A0A433QPN5_9FUNG|nr:hypothetical protein BC938DRAFT_477187 [Jimgerdemannia flammicorona]
MTELLQQSRPIGKPIMRAFVGDRDINRISTSSSSSSYHSSSSTLGPPPSPLTSYLPSLFIFSRRAIQLESSAPEDVIRYFYPPEMPVDLQMLIAGAVCSLSDFVRETVPPGDGAGENITVMGLDASAMKIAVWQDGVDGVEREAAAEEEEEEEEALCLVSG